MALFSWAFGHALASGRLRDPLRRAVPAFGIAGLLFGTWYALGALGTVPYVF